MRTESIERRAACFISPHGFGHAARASAVMEAACEMDAHLRFEIFTEVPRWFFQQSLSKAFGYHTLSADVGLVQKGPLLVDMPETLSRLDQFLPFDERLIESLALKLKEMDCRLVICDVAPLAIRVAERAGLPSVLVENFTWDWIYEEYAAREPRMRGFADYLKRVFEAATYHVQTEPVCAPRENVPVSPPVSRAPRAGKRLVRSRLCIPYEAKMVLITMGGVRTEFRFLERLGREREIFFVIPGASRSHEVRGQLVLLPYKADFYHPDLVAASDAVVCKLGYSTVAECYHAGVPILYVARRGFREFEVLARFVERNMRHRAVTESEFERAAWPYAIKELLSEPRERSLPRPNGAHEIAAFVLSLLKGENNKNLN